MRKTYNTIVPQYEIINRQSGTVGIRLRENFRRTNNGEVECDEYSVRVQDCPNMESELINNIRPWIAYARIMEARENSSAIQKLSEQMADMQSALIILGVNR